MLPVIPPRENMTDTERQIYGYVLGRLSGSALEELEDRLIADQTFFEQVEAVETDVCDDYAADRLSPADRAAFSERLHGNDRLQRRVALSRALQTRGPEPGRIASWSWWAVAAALLVVTAAAVWFARTNDDRAPDVVTVQSPVVTPPVTVTPAPLPAGPATSKPSRPAVLATLTLFGPVVRDPAQIPVMAIPAGDGLVRIEIALQDGDVFPAYRAEVTTQGGAAVWTAARLGEVRSAGGRMVIAELPSARLPAGLYQMNVYSAGASGSTRLASYPFSVTR
jgi:hypothetical protein